MAVFIEEPLYRDVPGGHCRELVVSVAVVGSGWVTRIPAGFVTDGASVPRVLWNILPPFGAYSRSALLHDWLYFSGECSRAEADRRFMESMEREGVSLWKRWVMYSGVRMGGWVAWNRYRSGQGYDRGA